MIRMPRTAFVPTELACLPFTRSQARLYRLTDDQLRGSVWRRIGRGVFARRAIADERMVRLQAALLRLPEGGVFSGLTAGWLYGLDVEPCCPIEVTVPAACRLNRRAGIVVRRSAVVEASMARGLPVTSRVRTVVDLVRARELVDAVTILDMALHRRMVGVAQVARWAQAHPGHRGVGLVRRVLELAEPATESPMETRLRLLLVLAGIPKPRVQEVLRDATGTFIARADLYYPRHRLAIEYDGSTHRDRLMSDNRRQNRLLDAGYRILRFTAGDVVGNPGAVVSLVRRALARPIDMA